MKTKSKILLTIAGAFALFSCGESSDSESATGANFEFSYTTDTVMVDAGEHFFFLNFGLGMSDVTNDSKLLYNLNPQTLLLEVVDLDNLKLKETIQLEMEGPNAVGGGFISKLQVLDNGNIMLFDFNKISEINPKGQLVRQYEFDKNTLSGYEFGETDEVSYLGIFSGDGKTYVASLDDVDYTAPVKGFTKINVETNEMTFVPTDAMSKLDEFNITLEMSGGGRMSTGESIFLHIIGDDFVFTNSGFNEVYIYDLSTDSLKNKTFLANLTTNERVKNFPTQVDSREELFASSKEKNKQVRFGPMINQEGEKLIWRFSKDLDRMIADSVVTKDVVTFFDQDFKMLKEQQLENFTNSNNPFFKDGMLYSFVNIDDEMAFVRLKPMISR
jgi:hypothetical protein